MADNLTDDLVVEILSRLPAKSLCRCKCVSQRWRALISDPGHRRKLPQTLAGVFHHSEDWTRFPKEARHFTNVREIWEPPLVCPSLSFLPGCERITHILDSCNGLLLYRLRAEIPSSSQDESFRYVVCNPATESWVFLPDSGCGRFFRDARLGFDPAVSLHFHVFEFVRNDGASVDGVQIYSCKTGAWIYKEKEWGADVVFYSYSRSIFHNGLLHLAAIGLCGIVAVDVEGETWLTLPAPDVHDPDDWEPGFLGQYQGHLCYINSTDYADDLSVWVLEDYATSEWTLKHHVSIEQLCEKMICAPGASKFYDVITVHPHCNLILYVAGQENTLMAYDMDRGETWAIKNFGAESRRPYLPYVPLYSESLPHGH